jgi:hypothetical protein
MYDNTYPRFERKLNLERLEGTYLKSHCNKRMSYQALMSYLITVKSVSGIGFLEGEVMRAFMSFGDSEGNNIRPSIGSIAALLTIHPNTVKKAISSLTKKGWLISEPVNKYDMQPVLRRFVVPNDIKERLDLLPSPPINV